MQIAPDQRQNGPVPFLSNIGGPIGFLQGELEWRLFDFCRIHQIVYKEINNIEVYLDKIDIEPLTNNKDDLENINKVRKMDYIVGQVHENERVTNFVDQMTVVGLWAIAEQFLGKIYKAFLSKKNEIPELNIQAPYRWDDFNREYNNLGIDLTTCENYQNADECRVLNNSIKHSPAVSSRLLQFAYFTKYSGQDIEKVPLEMQRYLNGVSDFLGSLIEKVNKSLA
jgi:hypothetical protein